MPDEITILSEKCTECGAPAHLIDCAGLPGDGSRFDQCENGHRFNLRPYTDGDKHYKYPWEVE